MSDRWKQIELIICRIFGGDRSGPVGKEGCDCAGTRPYAIQVKHREIPKWLTAAMDQAAGDAGSDLATLVLHPKGTAPEDSLVVFRLRDFRSWYLSD